MNVESITTRNGLLRGNVQLMSQVVGTEKKNHGE